MSAEGYSDPPEVPVFDLDPSRWHVALRSRDLVSANVHYVRASESLREWTELVSWEVTFRTKPWSLRDTRDELLRRLATRCDSLTWTHEEETANDLVFRWAHRGCYGRSAQTSLVRLLRGAIGTHQLTYARSSADVDPAETTAWIERLRAVRLESDLADEDDPVTRARREYWTGQDASAIAMLLPIAREGRVDAQEELAGLYFATWNLAEALRWFRAAALQDHPEALFHLGRMYENGWGLDAPEPAEARGFFARSADLGFFEAQTHLGVMLAEADAPDVATARGWFERASAQGDLEATYWLGRLAEEGARDARDLAHAAQWYERAARAGFARAQLALGRSYANGTLGPRDERQAKTWLVRAAMQGESSARDLYLARYRDPTAD